jgi:hypothetical protein
VIGNIQCETFWTIVATLSLLGMNFGDFLLKVLEANSENKPLPSLVNIGESVPQKYMDQARKEVDNMPEAEKGLAEAVKRNKEKREAKQKLLSQEKNCDDTSETGKDTASTGNKGQPDKRNGSTKSASHRQPDTPPGYLSALDPPETTENIGSIAVPEPLEPMSDPYAKPSQEVDTPPLSQKELDSQKNLVASLLESYRASRGSVPPPYSGGSAKEVSERSPKASSASPKPPAPKPNMRPLKAPDLAANDLEPAQTGLSATL